MSCTEDKINNPLPINDGKMRKTKLDDHDNTETIKKHNTLPSNVPCCSVALRLCFLPVDLEEEIHINPAPLVHRLSTGEHKRCVFYSL